MLYIFRCSYIKYKCFTTIASSWTDSSVIVQCTLSLLDFVLMHILSDISIATQFYFYFHFHAIFFTPSISVSVSLALKSVSSKQHINESYFFYPFSYSMSWLKHLIHLYLKWLLIGMYLLPFCYFWLFCSSFLFFSFSLFSCGLIFFFSIMFGFPCFLCIYCRFLICGYYDILHIYITHI